MKRELSEIQMAGYRSHAKGTEKWDTPQPIEDWHEDIGAVLWWVFPIEEPPYVGSPLDLDWPNYHTHWTHFVIPFAPEVKENE